MRKILSCLLAILLLATVAQAGYFEDCPYFQKNGRHNYVDDGYDRYPDCTQEGIKWVKCLVCGYRGISPVPRTEHKYGAWTEIVAASSNSQGVRSSTCSVCGAVGTQPFYPQGTVHQSRNREAIEAMQQMLVQLGYLSRVTGEYDKATEKAVQEVQKEANFPITGIGWPQTLEYLQQKLGGNAAAPSSAPTAVSQREAAIPAATAAPAAPQFTQQLYCSQTDISAGVVATVYCAAHQVLVENCENMLKLAQTDALRLQALTMYRMMLESDLQLRYAQWYEAAANEAKQIVLSHQAMSANYLSMQELTWKMQYGEGSLRVLENIVDALKQQCSDVCMMIGQTSAQQ